MVKIKQYAPQLIFLLMTSTLCMTYFVKDVVIFQVVVYLLVFMLYIVCKKTALHPSIALWRNIYILFAILYIARAFVELELLGHAQELYANNSTVYFFMITGMLMPALFVPKLCCAKPFNYAFAFLSFVICVSLLISLYNIFSGNVILTADHRIQASENLGVIQYGHLGLTGAIAGYMCYMQKQNSLVFRFVGVAVIAVGFVSMLMAGTRGALISVIVIMAIYLLVHAKFRSFIVFVFVAFALFLSIDSIESVFDSLGAASVTRIIRLFSEGGDQSSGRFDLWLSAINKIIESPFWGVSCFWASSENELTYVHNSFIEITYALGVFGLLVFMRLNWVAVKACIVSIRSSNLDNIAFSFFYLQYFIYTLFSDSIIRVPLYWYFLLMMLNIRNRKLLRNKHL